MRRARMRSVGRAAAGVATLLALVLGTGTLATAGVAAPQLTLVTLTGPGTAAPGGGAPAAERATLLARQDAVLASLGVEQPVYRWTTALNGFVAELTEAQVTDLEQDPRVALVEASSVEPLAGRAVPTKRITADVPRATGGAGVTIGFVDSGIAPESAVFAAVPGLGREPRSFTGQCESGDGWPADTCNDKLVGARWFVAGFGPQRVKSSESLSPRDVLGHGTQVASVAAGNSGVSVRVDGRDAGAFGGVAPQARVAVYKACWAAPDPADDGCASADVVTAIDRAVADGVDVLNLSIRTGTRIDTVQRALLGAAEADVVVVGAAGNTARTSYAAHPSPWVTTVGATVGQTARATAEVTGGPELAGGGRPTAVRARVVLAARARATGVPVAEARQCRPGTLDARKVAGRIVVCDRGGIGRIDKSHAVDQADGVGMVLVNVRTGGVTADFHAVPTVHLAQGPGRTLKRWVTQHPRSSARLSRQRDARAKVRAAAWNAPGDPRGSVVKPDAIASGDGVLGAFPDSAGRSWASFTGSSAAAAHASGLAALLRARHDWPATVVRSALVSTARPLAGTSVLLQGAGALGDDVPDTHLALGTPVRQWRRALESGDWTQLNTSSLLLPPGRRVVTRRVTNIGRRPEYFSVSSQGFTAHRVSVTPLAVRLSPGESARFRVVVTGPRVGHLDDGWIVWRGARGGSTRIPVALTR